MIYYIVFFPEDMNYEFFLETFFSEDNLLENDRHVKKFVDSI